MIQVRLDHAETEWFPEKEAQLLKVRDEMKLRETQAKVHRIRQKIGVWLGIVFTLIIGAERMQSYANALEQSDTSVESVLPQEGASAATLKDIVAEPKKDQSEGERFELDSGGTAAQPEIRTFGDKELEPLGEVNPKEFESIRTRTQACAAFEGKLIAFYDQTALIERCRLRLIEDALLLNLVRKNNPEEIRDIPASVFRLFEHGKPIREADLAGLESALGLNRQPFSCETMNGQYVTVSGEIFYFIEGCKKRQFERYAGLVEHNRRRQTVLTVTPALLAKLPDGKPMKDSGNDVADVWIQIDGDASWQRASRLDSAKEGKEDSPERLREIAKDIRKPVNVSRLCDEINGAVVSFYADLYFAEKCRLRPITERTLDLQVRLFGHLKIRDLSAHEKRALKIGKEIPAKDVAAKFGKL